MLGLRVVHLFEHGVKKELIFLLFFLHCYGVHH